MLVIDRFILYITCIKYMTEITHWSANCPKCGGENYHNRESPRLDGMDIIQEIICDDCDIMFTEHFKHVETTISVYDKNTTSKKPLSECPNCKTTEKYCELDIEVCGRGDQFALSESCECGFYYNSLYNFYKTVY